MIGYCLTCGRQCSSVSNGGRGYCEHHGWVFVNWTPTRRPIEIGDLVTVGEDGTPGEVIAFDGVADAWVDGIDHVVPRASLIRVTE